MVGGQVEHNEFMPTQDSQWFFGSSLGEVKWLGVSDCFSWFSGVAFVPIYQKVRKCLVYYIWIFFFKGKRI